MLIRSLKGAKIMAKSKIVKRFLSNGQEILIRYPKMSDCADLLKNINSLVDERAFIAHQVKQTKKSEEKWLVELLLKIRQKKSVALAVEINGRVVGLAQVGKERTEVESHVASFGISLRSEARGRGIGKKLLNAVIAEAKKVLRVKIITLTVFAVNKRAISLYRSCGFQKTETLKGGIKHYGKFFDRDRMVKYL